MDTTYPGYGACELCGHVDPCDMCMSVPTVLKLPQKLTKDLKDKTSPNKNANKSPK